MSKRTSIISGTVGRTVKAAAKAERKADSRDIITAVNLPAGTLELVRMVAVKRATTAGTGRPSVSAVLTDLIERHRRDLEAELH